MGQIGPNGQNGPNGSNEQNGLNGPYGPNGPKLLFGPSIFKSKSVLNSSNPFDQPCLNNCGFRLYKKKVAPFCSHVMNLKSLKKSFRYCFGLEI